MRTRQKSIINNFKTKIDSNIYIFLFKLFKDIFLKTTKKITDNNTSLNKYLDIINQKIIINEDKYLSKDYTIRNMNNIFDFVMSQNRIFAAEIIEGILICIFSLGFVIDKDESINKYIYKNLSKIRKGDNFFFIKWFKAEKFKIELDYIEMENFVDDYYNKLKEKSPFFNLLYKINKEKYKQINIKTKFYSQNTDILKIINNAFNSLNDETENLIDKDNIENSITKLSSAYLSNNFKNGNSSFGLFKAFFTSVFIYHQTKNSPLMNFIESPENKEDKNKENANNEIYDNKNELINVPYVCDFDGAHIEGKFANIIVSPIRMEPRISNLVFSRNNLREPGLYEISKALLFNKCIKSIDFRISIIRSYYLHYIILGLRLFDNFTVEKLNLSSNYLKENSGDFLAEIISHFKGLKSLNLSGNELKGGLSSFFIALKKLYRKRKTKIEVLYLNRCTLDDSSFYELGELIKCKYCKLKKLYLNNNPIPLHINFLKKIKKNKSLIDLYLNENKINKNDIDDINKIISNTNIRNFYLYKNEITNFDDCLKIIYRTKFIKNDNNNNIKNNSILMNLDLSNNNFFNKNSQHIKLLTKIANETTLSCLDISHIIYGLNPDKMEKVSKNEIYRKNVETLKNTLEEEKKNNIEIIKEIKSKNIDIKRLEKLNLENMQKYKELNYKVYEIIKDEKSKFPLFLKQQANKIIKDEIKNNNEKKSNRDTIKKEDEKNLINYMMIKKMKQEIKPLLEKRNERKVIIF